MKTTPLLLALATLATPAWAEGHPFAYAGRGSGVGHGAVGVGAGLMFNSGGALPALSLGFSYTLSEPVDLYLVTDVGFATSGGFGVLALVQPGLLFRFLGPPSSSWYAGLKLGPEAVAVATSRGGFSLFGAAPGAVLGVGSETLQFSLGADVPLYFGIAGSFGTGSGLAVAVRPYAVLEGAVADSLNVFVRGYALVALTGGGGLILAGAAVGIGF